MPDTTVDARDPTWAGTYEVEEGDLEHDQIHSALADQRHRSIPGDPVCAGHRFWRRVVGPDMAGADLRPGQCIPAAAAAAAHLSLDHPDSGPFYATYQHGDAQ